MAERFPAPAGGGAQPCGDDSRRQLPAQGEAQIRPEGTAKTAPLARTTDDNPPDQSRKPLASTEPAAGEAKGERHREQQPLMR
jgi:hypothetical protein